MDDFVHLHVHTEFSLLDSSCKIRNLVEKAKEMNMKAISITDHGVMYGCVEFYKVCKQYGIKPIIGCEIYVANKSMYIKNMDQENFTSHLVLLVKNQIGYKNLLKIVSDGSTKGFYYKPRVDLEFLRNHCEGLIALSACLSGGISKYILRDDLKAAKELSIKYKEIFGEDFYLELQNHGIIHQLKVNKELVKISEELAIQLVATNDVHYINKDDSEAHDVLICIQTSNTIDNQNRMKYEGQEFYLKDKYEMINLFSQYKNAIENTIIISEKCNFDYEFGKMLAPTYNSGKNISNFQYLRELCYEGLILKYEDFKENRQLNNSPNILSIKNNKIIERLEYELDLINSMGFVDYFLIVWDFIKFANEKLIPTGPGRGSVAGSIVAYVLNITKVDPIKYGLIFQRFLNPERISMPDIDSDFCYERRFEVIEYVSKKYGCDYVSQIITFGTMAARACIRDVGRAMNYTYGETDRVAKMIPNMLGITIDLALLYNQELKILYKEDERVKRLIDISKKLEGLPRHTSIHAAGLIISPNKLNEVIPVQRGDSSIISQFSVGNLEELGLLKMDFLGLRTLTVINDAVLIIKNNRNIVLDIDNISVEDKNVFDMIGEGKTCGIFQLESSGMTSFMKDLKPETIHDIMAGISLYRPGPMDEIPKYIRNKNNKKEVKYLTDELKEILNITYGVIVYQEQVMEIVQKLSGYSLGRSDLVRRAMSKKKHDIMEQERHNFVYGIEENGKIIVNGCIKNGIDEKVAHEIFDQMIHFAAYAFNKSHAAAYALIAYQTAYLMRYYKSEFICALLNSVINNIDKVCEYIRFSESFNIKIHKPSINNSFSRFVCIGEDIYFGLSAIKNVGSSACEKIVYFRENNGKFNNEYEFFEICIKQGINKKNIESLIKCGAFDEFGVSRITLLYNFEKIIDGISNELKHNIEGQISLFDSFEEKYDKNKIIYETIFEENITQNLYFEKEVLGLYISGHPIEKYSKFLDSLTTKKISDFQYNFEENNIINFKTSDKNGIIGNEDSVIIGGLIRDFKKVITKNNTIMSFLTLEDKYNYVECIVFPKVYDRFCHLIKEDRIVLIKGKVQKDEEQIRIVVSEIIDIDLTNRFKLYILVTDIGDINKDFEKIKPISEKYGGEIEVILYVSKERKSFKLTGEYSVNLSNDCICELEKCLSKNRVKVVLK